MSKCLNCGRQEGSKFTSDNIHYHPETGEEIGRTSYDNFVPEVRSCSSCRGLYCLDCLSDGLCPDCKSKKDNPGVSLWRCPHCGSLTTIDKKTMGLKGRYVCDLCAFSGF